MKQTTTLIALFLLLGSLLSAQTRYIDEVFSEVEVTRDVTYGVNATVFALPVVGEAIPEELKLDVYQPVGDTATERPLVIIFHTGNFLPHPQNGSTGGTRTDSAIVEIANRLTRMGYVTACASYRLGWNPIADQQQERTYTLINAAYRGVQDARTAIKFFRRNAAEAGNEYGVDTDKIVLWGSGTGGYVTLNTAVLDDYNKIPLTPGGKFFTEVGGQPFPMVVEGVNGDINCDSVGVVPANYPGFPAGDTLNYPNHVGYSVDFNLSVNMGGACGDTSWIDPGQVPIISYHVPTDPNAPYMGDVLIVPTTGDPVVEVFGAYTVQEFANRYGNNDVFAGMTFENDFSDVANSRNDGFDGLYPIIGTSGPDDSAPWQWWNPDENVNHVNGIMTNPGMSPEKGRTYLDTIIGYFAPRACVVLGLDCEETSSSENIAKSDFTVAPTPALDVMRIQAEREDLITDWQLVDMQGKVMRERRGINVQNDFIRRKGLASGQYILRVRFASDRMQSKLVIFQ
ncbi:MAG: T9SS type A sorting domain-containing protein [Bacteroidetes bacterium]|jgi:dienelactone hydrolase|nr:T9SS type A sorting domain-containing protein [Bacteroidota bacterium]